MDIVTALGAAQQGVKGTLDILRATAAAVVDSKVKAKLIEVQQSVLEIQSRLGDAQAERMALMDTVVALRESLRLAQSRGASLDSYELAEIDAGKFLRRSKPEAGHDVQHFACPNCYSAGKVAVIQVAQTGTQQHRYSCAACNFVIFVGPSDPPKRVSLSSPFRAREW